MGIYGYETVAPRMEVSTTTVAFVARDLLKRGMPLLELEKFGQSKPFFDPDYDWIDEIEDPLYVCAGCSASNCHAAQPHTEDDCVIYDAIAAAQPHTEDGCTTQYCQSYDPQVLDSQVGEYIHNYVKANETLTL